MVPAMAPVEAPAKVIRDWTGFIETTFNKVLDLYNELNDQSPLYVEQVDKLRDMLASVDEAIGKHAHCVYEEGYTMKDSYLSYWIDQYNYFHHKDEIEAFLRMAYSVEVQDADEYYANEQEEDNAERRRELAEFHRS